MIPIRLILAGIAAGGLVFAGWQVNGWRLGKQLAELKAEAGRLEKRNRETERQWAEHVIKIGEDANAEAERLRAAAARADAASRSLHDAAARRASEAASAAGPGSAASAAGVVLADVLRRADARAGELAAALDAARSAGLACERFHEVTR